MGLSVHELFRFRCFFATIIVTAIFLNSKFALAQDYSSALGAQVAPINPNDFGQFGSAVAIDYSGRYSYFGEPGRINPNALGGAARSGAVHIGTRSGNSWVLDPNPIFPSDGGNGDKFGYSIYADLSGNVAIGAPGNDGAGAVYVNGVKKVAPQRIPGENFGMSVATSFPTTVVGAPGSGNSAGKVYIFDECSFPLTAPDGAPGDFFGQSVAILHNGTVIVGAYGDDDAGNNSGSIYVYNFVSGGDGGWKFSKKILAAGPLPGDSFGYSMAASGDTLVVGAPFGTGAVYVYRFDLSGIQLEAKLMPSAPQSGALFGLSVAIRGDEILVGAPNWTNPKDGTVEGRAYYFHKSNGRWSERSILQPVTHSLGGSFALSVALDGKTALVGAPIEDCADLYACGKSYAFSKACTVNGECSDGSPCSDDICKDNICTYSPLGRSDDPYESRIFCSDDHDTTAGDWCLNGVCSGSYFLPSCPSNKCEFACVVRSTCVWANKPSGTLCRAAAGPCDSPEYCTGNTASCPTNTYKSPTTICREASGACDMPEYCSGEAAMCPLDAFRLSGSSCNDGLYCNGNDSCDGSGACLHSGNPCSGPDGDRNCSESCDETLDSCSAHDPDNSICSDGISATIGDFCSAGMCISGVNPSCKRKGRSCSADWQCCSLSCNLKTKKCR